MNLLCPSCQKMLQVPEQYAGQLMKCPLCTNTFTVPSLPQAPAPPPPPAPPAPPPPAPPSTAPAAPNLGAAPGSAQAPAQPMTPGGYAHTRSYTLNPRVIAWLPAVLLLLVFVLTFFPWVGMYPSGMAEVKQGGWGVAFNSADPDEVWKSLFKDGTGTIIPKDGLSFLTKDGPGVGLLTIFYLLLLLLSVAVALGGVLIYLKMIPVQLPPSMDQLTSFRPLLVAGLSLLTLGFLGLQLVTGFPIEDKTHAAAVEAAKKDFPDADTPEKRTKLDMIQGFYEGGFNLKRTVWLDLSVWFLVLAILFSLVDWKFVRDTQAPPPRIDLHY